MKKAGALALFLLTANAAFGSEIAAAARAANAARQKPAQLGSASSGKSQQISLTVRESHSLQILGATAAWAVDASIVDVSAQTGKVFLLARAPGRTKVMVIASSGELTFEVIVTGVTRLAAATDETRSSGGNAEVRYSSAAREIHTSAVITRESEDRKTELEVHTLHHAGAPAGDRARTSVPMVSYRIFTGGRELTFFDRDIDHSPLTLRNTPLRGVHYVDDAWRLHAGYTSWAAYQSFLVPVERELVFGGGYRVRLNDRASLTPSVFAFAGEGTVASLLYAYDDRSRLAFRGEVGYSRGFGAAADLTFDSENDRVRADVRYRPEDFAAVRNGSPRGFFADASWSHDYGRGSNAAVSMSASDADERRVLALSADTDHRVTDRLSLTGGASWGSFDSVSTLTAPIGFRYDLPRAGVSALYRYARSGTNQGGHGFRVAVRASLGRFHASGYVDRQQNAPTLDLIFSERPDLALALAELGIAATSPSDIARALREHATLVELGFIEGVTVDLAPMRTQLGLEASWLGVGPSRQQLRARFARSVTESVASRTTSTIATLSYSRSLTASTDVFASYSHWRTERRGSEPHDQPFIEAGVRQRFDGLPSIIGGTGTISGTVYVDDDLDGRSDGQGVVALIELDGRRTEKTRADGSFRFSGVEHGSHRLVVSIPGRADAYFTTPSRVEVETGDNVSFGIASTPARVNGFVRSDAGSGIAAVRVLLSRGGDQIVAVTESNGAFSIAAAPGEWQLSLLTDSVPSGFSLAGADARNVRLDRAKPLDEQFTLRAHRSISGTGAAPHGSIEIQPLGKVVKADAEGRFSLRSLPAGAFTLVSGAMRQTVVLAHDPSTVKIDLAPVQAIAAASTLPRVPTRVTGERRETMRGYLVQLGAFRVRSNADAVVARAWRSGVEARIESEGALAIVRSGPFESRDEAMATVAHLARNGVEAVVMANN